MSTLERAIAIAAEAHAGQTDKGGQPYILHPLRVMLRLDDEAGRIVAVLHDLLEDCPEWTSAGLRVEGFAPEVLAAIESLTKRAGETYEAFIERAGRDEIARRVKLADLAENSDLSRIAAPSPKDRERLAKYERAIAALEAA